MSDVPETPEPTLPVESAVAADQIAAHATAGHGHHGPFHTHCENCGTKLEGPFCHKCGQHDFEFHRSFWHVFLEALESFLHFDSKLFHTVATLIFRPGRLTAEFNAGKRASQMPPLRLYIFVSLVFFFLFFLDNHAPDFGGQDRPSYGGIPTAADERAWNDVGEEFADNPAGNRTPELSRNAAEKTQVAAKAGETQSQPSEIMVSPPEPPAATAGSTQPDEVKKPKPRRSHNAPFVQWLQTQGQRLANPAELREMVEKFLHALPKMLLFCLPFFALYTRVLFRKAGLVYLQHLVLALHFHTLILLWSMLKDGWVFLGGFIGTGVASWIGGIFNLWLLLYPFLMFRHLFAGSWPKTIIKTGLFGALYGCTLVFTGLVGGFIIFAML